ncbi:MAG: AAA family ATPase [Planctomycetes bacterium]|nr:AAA family ATPase [Planctomycetota bacterium]
MTPEQLQALITVGETLAVEFKGEEQAPLPDRELVETVVCLANRPGNEPGWLFVGVEDDGRVTGARPRHEAGITDTRRVQALIANRTRPSLTVRAELLAVRGCQVLAIEVPPSTLPLGTADGHYLRRAIGGRGKPECVPFHFHEMLARQADRGALDYSALVVPEAGWDALDPLEFERYRRTIRESQGTGDQALLDLPDVELAKALGGVEADREVRGIRVLGLLLFGREDALRRFLPTHEVAFQVLVGTSIEVNEFYRWPLLRVMEDILLRFRARNREKELMDGLFRIGVPDYPERAFREGVANALIHRDYTRLGAVHIQWHPDRIEVSNPGGFPEGVRLDNLLVTPPRPRNPLLADAFKRAGIVERTARGIDTIFYEQLRSGRPAPSYERSSPTDVVLVLPGGEANLEFVRLVVEEGRAGRPTGVDGLLLLNHLWLERQLTTAQASEVTQKPEAEARTRLQALVEAGLVEARGGGKGRAYHLAAAIYRRLGEESAYVRQRGFEPIQREQMVIQFVKRHGTISRAEAAELCKASPLQAYRLLQRLVNKGVLEPTGPKGRGVRYQKRAR